MANPALPEPILEFICDAHVAVGAPLDLGDVGKGGRRIVPILGGRFTGSKLCGEVLPGGADWQILRSDGVAELAARYTLRTDDGALIGVCNHALRHGPADVMQAIAAGQSVAPDRYYFRGAVTFETAAKDYAWLARHIVVCAGHREKDSVALRFYAVT
jgi:Protein of unknown function (DUF3237)